MFALLELYKHCWLLTRKFYCDLFPFTYNLGLLGLITAFKKMLRGFSGGPVVRNPPANAGDTGLILGPGRFHISHTTKAQGDTTTELTL